MAKTKTSVPFQGTPEQEAKLLEIIKSYNNDKSSLISILQGAQELYGYLPIEVQKIIANELDVSLSEVYGVVTFYAQFTLNPKGRYNISVCLGTACYVKGSGKIIERFREKLDLGDKELTADGKFSLQATRCIGACGLAPVCVVNDDVYGRLVPDDVDKIIAKYA